MIKNYFNLIMNVDNNALANLPNIVKFQLMTLLSFMWSIIFTLMVGSYLVLGPTLILHILFLLGVFFTSELFRKVKRR